MVRLSVHHAAYLIEVHPQRLLGAHSHEMWRLDGVPSLLRQLGVVLQDDVHHTIQKQRIRIGWGVNGNGSGSGLCIGICC